MSAYKSIHSPQLIKISDSQLLVNPPNVPAPSLEFSDGHPTSTAIEKIVHDRITDLRARTTGAVDSALHEALDELKNKWPPEKFKNPTTPAFLEVF